MLDRGFFLTGQAIRYQLAAMPHDLYLIRLIHQATRSPFPGERLWTANQLSREATIRFLRLRNREGCDVYLHPYAEDRNARYILVDLDSACPAVVDTMRSHGLEPCVVVQTSPGHLQAWLHVSPCPLGQLWPQPSPSEWHAPTERTWPAPAGVTWEDSPDSPTKSPRDAHPPVTRRGLPFCTPVPVWLPGGGSAPGSHHAGDTRGDPPGLGRATVFSHPGRR